MQDVSGAKERVGARALLKREVKYLGAALRDGFVRGAVVVGALALLFALKVALLDDALLGQRFAAILVGFGYALYLGTIAGLVLAVATVVWRTVGAWILVPLVVVPATLWFCLWLFEGFLARQLQDVWEATKAAASDREWLVLAVGPAARIGPVILVVALPLLLVDLGALAFDPGVLWQLVILAAEVFGVVALGTIPAALFSLGALGVAYARRFRRRHAQT